MECSIHASSWRRPTKGGVVLTTLARLWSRSGSDSPCMPRHLFGVKAYRRACDSLKNLAIWLHGHLMRCKSAALSEPLYTSAAFAYASILLPISSEV